MEQSMRGSRNFCQGGGPGPTARKQPGQSFLFLIVQSSAYFTEGVQWFDYRGNYNFSGGGGEGPTFSKGVQHLTGGPTFSRGKSIDNNTTHSVLDFKPIEESFIS